MNRTETEKCVWLPKELMSRVEQIADIEDRSVRKTLKRLLETALKTYEEKKTKEDFI